MVIDLEPVFNCPGKYVDIDYTIDLTSKEYGGAFPFAEPVKVKGRIQNECSVVELCAGVVFPFVAACDRCASSVSRQFDFEFRHILAPSLENEDSDDIICIDVKNFNLDELITDDIFLSLPSKFLCKDDCKGVCAGCGADLNREECRCKKEVDPRLAVLQQLLDN